MLSSEARSDNVRCTNRHRLSHSQYVDADACERAADVRAVGDALRPVRDVGDVHVEERAEVLGEERASIKERGQRCAGNETRR